VLLFNGEQVDAWLVNSRRGEQTLMKFTTWVVPLVSTAILFAASLGPRQPVGEILNPSVESLDAGNRPASWVLEPVPRGNAVPGGEVSTETAHAGTHSLMLSEAGRAWTNKTLVKPYAVYRLIGWIKTQDVPSSADRGAAILARGVKVTSPVQRIDGTRDWTRVELTFMRTIADYRQLNDALFHAGPDSGSRFEWEDTANRLHFYVLDVQKDAKGILSYAVGIRSLNGSGPQVRGVEIAPPEPQGFPGQNSVCLFALKNTGAARAADPSAHPQNAAEYLDSDIYRLSVSIEGEGWSARLRNTLAAVKFGDSGMVPVFVMRTRSSSANAALTLTAVSESDSSKTSTAKCRLSAPKAR
jgi:hypothetical protein